MVFHAKEMGTKVPSSIKGEFVQSETREAGVRGGGNKAMHRCSAQALRKKNPHPKWGGSF